MTGNARQTAQILLSGARVTGESLSQTGAYLLRAGLKVRTIMLAFYAGVAIGCFLMVAWVYMLKYSTPHAIALLRAVAQ